MFRFMIVLASCFVMGKAMSLIGFVMVCDGMSLTGIPNM
jgi:hypothetical protein